MKKIKKILSSILLGVLGFAMSLCVAPIVAVIVVCYMTKISFETGYQDNSEKEIDKLHQELDESLNDYER